VFDIQTVKFVGDTDGKLKEVHTVLVEWVEANGRKEPKVIPGSEKVYPAQLVLIAMGFLGPEDQLLGKLGIERDARSNVNAPYGAYTTNIPGVFSAGDMRRGQVWWYGYP
jgi:glutamate synthase (NADPH/NADH) small chain